MHLFYVIIKSALSLHFMLSTTCCNQAQKARTLYYYVHQSASMLVSHTIHSPIVLQLNQGYTTIEHSHHMMNSTKYGIVVCMVYV